jgi:succinyl-CoA synthetase beta subunit
MRLLEFEGKRYLAAHGLCIPAGSLWPSVPESVTGYVVKAQIPEGGRGKRGGIAFVSRREDVPAAARQLLGRPIAGYPVHQVYVEECLEIVRELYLAVMVDRDARCYTFLASPDGGMDVETVSRDRLLNARIDPLLGVQSFLIRRLLGFLAVPRELHEAMTGVIRALFAAIVAEDAELIEINPLVLTAGGKAVAADAKMVVDDNAAYRHRDWGELSLSQAGSDVERRVGAAGATAVEVEADGTVIGVVSGAGLMMATLDLFVAAGARVRYMVDLGGTPLSDRSKLVPILGAMTELKPDVLFINAYFQTALADDFARAIVDAHEASPITSRVIVRLKGRNAEAARQMLAGCGFEMYEDFVEGVRAALRAAGNPEA